MHTAKILALGVVVAALAAATAGCGQKRITECNAMVHLINDGVSTVEKLPKNETDPSGVSDLRAMAEAMDKVATDAGNVQLTLPELKKLRDDYQKMAKDIAKAERELAASALDKDTTKRNAAAATLDAAVKQEDPLVDQINKFCQAH
jgi:hypothetical protein